MHFDNSYSRLPGHFYSEIEATSLENPFLISWNSALAEEMEISSLLSSNDAAAHFGEMVPLAGSRPIAAVYAGHQFGHYVPQLGDGRSILLGEWMTEQGVRWDLHLKGGGRTPYSRMGDGRAVLRSTIREYLCSEAMHYLGIPTTRALCIVGSEEEVHRERIESGATLLRTAQSHVRIGTFEYFYYRGEAEPLQQLLEYLCEYHFPELLEYPPEQRALELFREVRDRTAALIAQWQLVGFAHGVMNSDNMSILGLTIDYGPYGFLDRYDPGFICNHSDYEGRYAFDQQPQIAQWNLRCLAQALMPLIPGEPEDVAERLREELVLFQHEIEGAFEHGMCAKLGLSENTANRPLWQQWLALLERQGADYTRSFRALASPGQQGLRNELNQSEGLMNWLEDYRARLAVERSDEDQRIERMRQLNPKYILRNYLAQQAIEMAESGDFSEIERLLALLRSPFDEQPEWSIYAASPPEWAEHISVSCSS